MKFGPSPSKFRHMYGTESVGAERTYTNLEPCLSSSSDSPLIECNDAYWAIPYKGGGGPVYVSRHNNYGKVLPSCNLINGHKSSVLDIGFSHFHSDIMATASGDTKVKIWKLPSPGTIIYLFIYLCILF
jgi:WD40 repeat protein